MSHASQVTHTSSPCRLLFVFGTRPEYIKLYAIFVALAQRVPDASQIHLLFTSQHPDLVDTLELHAHGFTLHVLRSPMTHQQSLNALLSKLLSSIDAPMATLAPRLVIVQGDTTSALAGALAAFHHHVPVAHVEAGLRTPSLGSPFPEEANRRLISTLATHHYPPTQSARDNLLAEGVPHGAITLTGNTSIDRLRALTPPDLHNVVPALRGDSRRLVLMTLHRRENLEQLPELLEGLGKLLLARPDVHVLWPRHPNPEIRATSERLLGDHAGVTLLPALTHEACVALLGASELVLTDSGGLQEEAITLGVPVLVMREYTDRPEGVAHGRALLAGATSAQMLEAVKRVLDTPPRAQGPCDLYGAGDAGERIARHALDMT